jgi:hypothetical protein
MANTMQAVSWSLEMKCPFRGGKGWRLPHRTRMQLSDLTTIAELSADKRIFDGICVTGTYRGKGRYGNRYCIPDSGFRISDRLGKYGGLEVVTKTCGQCEANVELESELKLAGCFGHLLFEVSSKELDARLWKIVNEYNLRTRLQKAFPITTPLVYGFWINSPLDSEKALLLEEIFSADDDFKDFKSEEVNRFREALQVTIHHGTPLHVFRSPPGHVDMGWLTTFPHCPKCKVMTDVEPWKQPYPKTPYACKVCQYIYIPNDHCSSERYDFERDKDSLAQLFTASEYHDFTKRYLLQQGCPEKMVDEVIASQDHSVHFTF